MLLKVKDGDNWFVIDSSVIRAISYRQHDNSYHIYTHPNDGGWFGVSQECGTALMELIGDIEELKKHVVARIAQSGE